MNIAVSGWNGAGSSTLCLILAKNLNLKLFQGTQTFRLLGQKLSYSQHGIDRIKADDYLEYIWGPIYDKYIDHILLNQKGLIIETDIGAFRLGKRKEFYSIFLKASLESRASRVVVDGRSADKDVLAERDSTHKKNYQDLHGFNWFDEEEIKNKYNLVIDNSNLNIAEELDIIFKEFRNLNLFNFQENIDTKIEESEYWSKGKEFYQNYLKSNNLVIEGADIVRDIRNHFAKEITDFPKDLQMAINSI